MPELGMDEPLAKILNIGGDLRERVEWKQFNHKDIGRLLGIVGVRADEMIQFLPAPRRVDVVLREKQQKQGAALNLRHKIVAKRIARLESVVDEEVLTVVAWPGVQVVGERRDPAVFRGRAERFYVIRVGIADEDIVGMRRPVRHATLTGRSLGCLTYHGVEPDAKWLVCSTGVNQVRCGLRSDY